MAVPHSKNLLGREGGKKSQHWYDYTLSRRRIKMHPSSNGGGTKPGTRWILWTAHWEEMNPNAKPII